MTMLKFMEAQCSQKAMKVEKSHYTFVLCESLTKTTATTITTTTTTKTVFSYIPRPNLFFSLAHIRPTTILPDDSLVNLPQKSLVPSP